LVSKKKNASFFSIVQNPKNFIWPRMTKLMSMDEVSKLVMLHDDWPKKGVTFCDIFSILENPLAARSVLVALAQHIYDKHNGKVDAIVGLGARGFLIGPQLAEMLEKPFYPVRKEGELPGPCITDKYKEEYGESVQTMRADTFLPGTNVILVCYRLVDDLLAPAAVSPAPNDSSSGLEDMLLSV
jgi:adenine phosphoribosyltransferase